MDSKRRREGVESSGTKRIRADVLLTILDDDDDADDGAESGGRNESSDDLAAVMRSLEQEIILAASTQPPPELGYLLEASDDELGIPPLEEERGDGETERAAAAMEAVWFGDNDTARFCAEWLELGFVRFEEDEIVTDLAVAEDVVIDGGPFDYARGVWSV